MISIHMRSPVVDEHVIFGHWGSLVKGACNASADATVAGLGTALNCTDAQRRLSMTYDQGREMSQLERLSEMTGVNAYFAAPHSPWPPGINESTKVLLRQYFPKGTDLSGFIQAELDAVAWQLNTRRRKSLGWKCSAELSMPESFHVFEPYHQPVALRT